MQLANFVEEVRYWTAAVQAGDERGAEKHLDELYHRGASLVASRELQNLAMELWGHPLDQQALESLRLFLGLVQAAASHQSQNQPPMSEPLTRAA